MRLLVCGGRAYSNRQKVNEVLNGLHAKKPIAAVIHGCAKGADFLASLWAQEKAIKEERYPADWATWGKSAGFIRNRKMLNEGRPDLVVAFPGGKGTAMMMRIAREAEVEVREFH